MICRRYSSAGLYYRRSPEPVADSRYFRLRAALATVCCAWLRRCLRLRAPHVPGELMVKYRPARPRRERDRDPAAAGVRSAGAVDGRTQRVDGARAAASAGGGSARARPAGVVHAVPNYVATATAFTPNDPGRGGPGRWAELQWNFTGPFGVNARAPGRTRSMRARRAAAGVIVAVLDTGVAYRTSRDGRYIRRRTSTAARFVRGHDFVRETRYPTTATATAPSSRE